MFHYDAFFQYESLLETPCLGALKDRVPKTLAIEQKTFRFACTRDTNHGSSMMMINMIPI